MATRTFRGTINADWNTAGNWLELAAPTVADDVVFDAASPACTLSGAGNCLTLDCTGFPATITPGANTITVAGTVFKLAAGCWVAGTALVDFTAAAGTVLITSAGNALSAIRTGNGGAGATYRLQDNLSLTLDHTAVNGAFDTNNNTFSVGQDFLFNGGTFAAGASLFIVGRHWVESGVGIFTPGTSTVRFSGAAGQLQLAIAATLNFYVLDVCSAGNWTITGAWWGVNVSRQIIMGAGIASAAVPLSYSQFVLQPATAGYTLFDANPAGDWRIPMGVYLDAAGGGTWDWRGGTFTMPNTAGAMLVFFPYSGCLAPVSLRLTQSMTLTGSGCGGTNQLLMCFGSWNGVYAELDLNGFDLNSSGGLLEIRNWRVDLNGANLNDNFGVVLDDAGGVSAQYAEINIPTGSILTTGNFTAQTSGGYGRLSLTIKTGGRLSLGGSWDSSTVTMFQSTTDAAVVRFTAAGAFTLLARPGEPFPTVEITAGGIVTLPLGFNCYDLVVTNGNVTINQKITVRHIYTLGALGSTTITADINIGSGFVNAGAAVLAGSNIFTLNPLCSISGINPDILTVGEETQRLQLLTACDIANLVIQPRRAPGVIQFLAGATFNVASLDAQIDWPDAPVQFISSVAGTPYNLNLAAVVNSDFLWPRDCWLTGLPIIGNLTNKNLGDNAGWTLNAEGVLQLISDDPGLNPLAALDIGSLEYCWLAADTALGLAALAAAFGAGANNWHRRTSIPFAILDNLGAAPVFVALGLRDDRDRRAAPNVGAGDFTEGTPEKVGAIGGAPTKIVATTQFAF